MSVYEAPEIIIFALLIIPIGCVIVAFSRGVPVAYVAVKRDDHLKACSCVRGTEGYSSIRLGDKSGSQRDKSLLFQQSASARSSARYQGVEEQPR